MFPWVVFAWFGATVAFLQDEQERHGWLRTTFFVGLGISVLVLIQTIQTGRPMGTPNRRRSVDVLPRKRAVFGGCAYGSEPVVVGCRALLIGASSCRPWSGFVDRVRAPLPSICSVPCF